MVSKLKPILNGILKVEKFLSAISVAVMTVLVVCDIFGREIFSQGIPWAQKVSVYMMIWAGFLGAGMTTQKGAHLRPEIADKLWPEKFHGIFHRLRHLITAIFCLAACYFSSQYVASSYELGDKNPILDLPLWIVQLVIPFTFFLMGFKSLIFTIFKELMPPSKREAH